MKNITVSLDDDIYQRAHARAAELDTSVSALVKLLLLAFVREDSATEQLKLEEARLREAVDCFRARGRLTREDIRDRASQ